ncbi:MAG TPA: bifunctional hydroxymethylpyrimidine kinase/phosphomethylpyrimidine kinase [Magnetospirillaceae bacterium]|nr:bifunctional hydroxymethylpyrimidine kinase/phosphomethylpyrimidine kinase [Magnetospirillaceae bacterium]
MKCYRRALTIAGSDSGGGAGIQADLKTFSALGCFGMSAITALTAQNTQDVSGILAVPPEFVAAQIDAVFSDIGADAVKIGMLHSAPVILAVAASILKWRPPFLVLDPVMVAKGGARLLEDSAIEALREKLFPLATVVTPNLPEAAAILGLPESVIRAGDGMADTARRLAELGPRAVLIKGGHLGGRDSPDLLYIRDEDRLVELPAMRVETVNTHGTGCTLSSAIAAFLARGLPLCEAAAGAKRYLTAAIEAGSGYRIGGGHGPVHHFHRFWE